MTTTADDTLLANDVLAVLTRGGVPYALATALSGAVVDYDPLDPVNDQVETSGRVIQAAAATVGVASDWVGEHPQVSEARLFAEYERMTDLVDVVAATPNDYRAKRRLVVAICDTVLHLAWLATVCDVDIGQVLPERFGALLLAATQERQRG